MRTGRGARHAPSGMYSQACMQHPVVMAYEFRRDLCLMQPSASAHSKCAEAQTAQLCQTPGMHATEGCLACSAGEHPPEASALHRLLRYPTQVHELGQKA